MESFRTRSLTRRKPRAARGFTLVELLVTMTILMVITAIAVTGQSTFNQSQLLTDTSYTVALSAREAQTLGLSSRKFAGVQNGGYGLHFTNGTPTKYIVFADISSVAATPAWCPVGATHPEEQKAGNCLFDSSGGETFQTYDLTRGFTISDFCGRPIGGGALQCSSTNALLALDVTYLGTPVQFSCAQVYIQSPTGGVTQTVRMSSLGEVSVGQTCP
jgi:prepilin-type N-terminal cleavage/methylation domain-containing protein